MELFLKSTALVLAAVILALVLGKNREMGTLLSLAACAAVCTAAAAMLEPAMDLLEELRLLGGLSREFLRILLKSAGIGIIGELAAMICTDAGEHAMAKAVGLLSNTALLLLSLPLIRRLMELLEEVLGGL